MVRAVQGHGAGARAGRHRRCSGKVKVVKLDVDQNPTVTGKYGIRAMPTLMLFKNGQVAAQHTGALVQKKKLEDWINSANVASFACLSFA